ncbi:hypothetical protein KEM56_002649 [Ascosphaera pollenicola]|nr:hypothetical protein KEM56_002649 [Ascosphaera pollenicola]
MHSLFSQKNLLRLAALADSQRTLSLFTPSVAEAAFRACASVNNPDSIADANASSSCTAAIAIPAASGSGLGLHGYSYGYGASSPALPLSRTVSQCQQLLPDSASTVGSYSSRQSVSGWSGYGLNLGAGRHAHGKHGANKKKKRRVVDLRKTTTTTTPEAEEKQKEEEMKMKMKMEDKELKTPMTAEPEIEAAAERAATPSISVPSGACDVIAEESQEQVITPRRRSSTEKKKTTSRTEKARGEGIETHPPLRTSTSTANINDFYISSDRHQHSHTQPPPPPSPQFSFPSSAPLSPCTTDYDATAAANAAAVAAACSSVCSSYFGYNPYATGQNIGSGGTGGDGNSGILEQALMIKMAGELARRMQQQPKAAESSGGKRMGEGEGEGEGIPPPPPYRQ